jgi:hypothetical protein
MAVLVGVTSGELAMIIGGWAMFVLDVAVGILLVRAWRAGVRAETEGVRVRNDFRTTLVPWSDVQAFEVSPSSGMGILRRRSGDAIRLHGLSAWNPLFAGTAETKVARIVAQLEDERRRHAQATARSRRGPSGAP